MNIPQVQWPQASVQTSNHDSNDGPASARTQSEVGEPAVAIVHHFFAHYRGAVIRELITHGRYHYVFVGDTSDPLQSGIACCNISKSRFIRTRSKFFGKFLVQAGLINLAFRPDIGTIVYLGDAQFLTTWISAACARLAGKHVLFWSHGWPRLEKGIKDRIRCLFYRIGHGMVLYSNRSKAIGASKGFDPGNLHVIYNSLESVEQKEWLDRKALGEVLGVRTRLFKTARRPMLICTGRLVKYRHLELLICAMDLLHAEGHPVNLLLVGDGPEESHLRELIHAKGLDDAVIFYGACYERRELADLITAANVTVIPGRVGLTAVQSLAHGVPVISHDDPDDQGPEWEAIVPGVNGDLYHHGDIDDLARKIKIWTRDESPDLRTRAACCEVVEKFYNPSYQRAVMDQAVAGQPARDEIWKKWLPLVSS
jgi:glycosyltransferase involved in cell wall biosynthesis